MKIVSWNCRLGFDGEKPGIIEKNYKGDILVIPECREKDMKDSGYDKKHRDWYGDDKEATDASGKVNNEKSLGIGIFWKEGIVITQLPEWKNTLRKNSNFRYLVPYKVEGDFEPFTLIAVWTKAKNIVGDDDTLEYVQKAHAAIDHYKNIGLLNKRVVLIGDFNSNKIWDGSYRKDQNHSALVEKLKQEGIIDCSGSLEEKKNSTYYYYTKNKEKDVIDDYCFASVKIAESANFSVPNSSEWKSENGVKNWHGSDHCPISVEFEF